MTEGWVLGLGRQALYLVLMVGGPILALSAGVGLVISLFQATTQINEQTLTFIPKILAIIISLVVFGPWMMTQMVEFTVQLFRQLPVLIG